MSTLKKSSRRFRVGDKVIFFFGAQKVKGTVLEDRGLLSAQGRLYKVGFGSSDSEPTTLEVRETDLKRLEYETSWCQKFRVTYQRQAESNHWCAKTEWLGRYHGKDVKSSVAFSAARWEGLPENGETSASLVVFVESDPRFDKANWHDHPQVLRQLIEETRELADALFVIRHPGAKIERRDDADPPQAGRTSSTGAAGSRR